jgi:hypothetical protein
LGLGLADRAAEGCQGSASCCQGGSKHAGHPPPTTPQVQHDYRGLTRLRSLHLSHCPISDGDFVGICTSLPALECLHVTQRPPRCSSLRKGPRQLLRLTQLTELKLSINEVGDRERDRVERIFSSSNRTLNPPGCPHLRRCTLQQKSCWSRCPR